MQKLDLPVFLALSLIIEPVQPAHGRKKRKIFVSILRWLLIVVIAIAAILFATATIGMRVVASKLTSHPNPVKSYDESLARFAAIEKEEATLPLMPEGKSILMVHGNRTPKAVVFLHGMTSVPFQFQELGKQMFDAGWNVFIPRAPHHGMADRKSSNLSKLRAEELRDYGDAAVDVGVGLGDELVVCGLSQGGAVAAWIIQNRADAQHVVMLSPAVGLVDSRGFWIDRFGFVVLPLLPDFVTDNITKDPNAPKYCYPGFASRGLGELLRLGAGTIGQSFRAAPASQSAVLVTSQKDVAINNAVIWQLVSMWRVKGIRQLTAYDFPKAEGVEHDMIDPHQTYQRVSLVYPIVTAFLERNNPGQRIPTPPASN